MILVSLKTETVETQMLLVIVYQEQPTASLHTHVQKIPPWQFVY